ncbi:MAG: response regulator transcription factor [Clostridia bacterium]|nr:response regulator transcription factor [Clostridia bacterium]
MRIAICDDNMNHINIIENYIHDLRKTSIECDAYQSGEELIRSFRDGEEQYDVIFLDMEMEQLNGIETANYIREIDEHVIIVFVTSHTEYMRDSFKCAPFRFLVKPVDVEEFKTVFYDISKKLSKQRKVFAFTENKAKIRLYCDDIIYCESQDHWIWIHTKDKVYKICKSLTELHGQLDKEMFCRVHKSYIINFLYIKSIKDNDAELYHCDKTIAISRSYKKEVLEEYTNFLERDFRV